MKAAAMGWTCSLDRETNKANEFWLENLLGTV
jgi:hypothetical protein